MKKRLSDEQILSILKKAEAGMTRYSGSDRGRSQGSSATHEIECCHENLHAFNH